MTDFNLAFLILMVLILTALGVTNFIESKTKQYSQVGQGFFGLLYIVFALALVVYKISSR